MNNSYLTLAGFILIFSFSCNDTIEGPIKPPIYAGEMRFKLDKEISNYCIYGKYVFYNGKKTIGLIGDHFNGSLMNRNLNFVLPDSTGTFQIKNEVDYDNKLASATYYYVDSDVILASYNIPENKINGFIRIDSFNSTSGKIIGGFQCVLYLKNNYGLSNPKDSIIIEEGTFETIIKRD